MMCAQGLRSSALLCGKSASKNTVFLPSVCVCFRAKSDPLAVSQTARRATLALLFADSSPAILQFLNSAYISTVRMDNRFLTLCECGSCLWFPCVRSRGWLRQIVTPSPQAPSASAWQTQETKEINVSCEHAAGCRQCRFGQVRSLNIPIKLRKYTNCLFFPTHVVLIT